LYRDCLTLVSQFKNMKNFIKKILTLYLWVLFLPISLTLKLILFIFKMFKRLFFFIREKGNNF
jgi:hypothetical protein